MNNKKVIDETGINGVKSEIRVENFFPIENFIGKFLNNKKKKKFKIVFCFSTAKLILMYFFLVEENMMTFNLFSIHWKIISVLMTSQH